eukprot:6213771-Pyramimonas_sp.AAC.1
MQAPGRLPQVPRPSCMPTPGSKSSVARARRVAQRQIAVTSRNDKFHTLYGDCVQSQREQLAAESSRGGLASAGAGDVDFDECEFGFGLFEGLQDEEG